MEAFRPSIPLSQTFRTAQRFQGSSSNVLPPHGRLVRSERRRFAPAAIWKSGMWALLMHALAGIDARKVTWALLVTSAARRGGDAT